MRIAAGATADDLVVCLVSGGGSAILEAPAAGVGLDDLIATNEALLTSGADIVEFNTVRKHLSRVKGGRLAAAAGEAALLTLVLSDVVGDPLDVIASGPTVPDPTTYRDALRIVGDRGLRDVLPAAVLGHLEAGRAGEIADTPSHRHPRSHVSIVGNGRVAAEAAAAAAVGKGLAAEIVTTDLTGEARLVATDLVARDGRGLEIFAGETTVTVTGAGTGGRNQEGALAAAIAIDGRSDVMFLAAGTDGIDGPTPAAGAVVDGTTVSRGAARRARSGSLFSADNDALRSSTRPATSSSPARPAPTLAISGSCTVPSTEEALYFRIRAVAAAHKPWPRSANSGLGSTLSVPTNPGFPDTPHVLVGPRFRGEELSRRVRRGRR